MKTLHVFLNAEHVGFLYFERGQLSFEYVEGVVTSLSWHLPIQAEAFEHAQVEAFIQVYSLMNRCVLILLGF